jgi:hypothetical protein
VGTPSARVAVLSDHIFINGTVFQFYAQQDHRALLVSPCWRLGADDVSRVDLSRFDVVIAKSDLAWIRRKSDGCFKGPNGREEYRTLLERIDRPQGGFHVLTELPLPDGSSLRVFAADHGRQAASAVQP